MSVRGRPTAVLQVKRSPAGPRLAVTCCGRDVSTELVLGREVLWSGPWEWEVRCDGQPVESRDSWDETCRYRDADVDYLELQIRCGSGVRIDRHLLLAREDRFLLLADAILSRRRAKIEYRGSLPLAEGVHFQAAKATNEGLLKGRRARALVVPLAMPEWREAGRGTGGMGEGLGFRVRGSGSGGSETQPGPHHLNPEPRALNPPTPIPDPRSPIPGSRCLELSLSAEGSCLFAPLFVDLKSRRPAKSLTWRQLTVGENLTAQPRDVAVGYRLLIGRKQWLIYRALEGKGNRTLLGHNLSTEFLVARFLRRGKVEPLLEIE